MLWICIRIQLLRYLNADPDTRSQTNADPDPDPLQTLTFKKLNLYVKNVLNVIREVKNIGTYIACRYRSLFESLGREVYLLILVDFLTSEPGSVFPVRIQES